MKVKEILIKDLKMYENNPRNNDQAVDEVAESIKNYGFKVPMVIDKDNVIVCGHTRYKACLKLGIEKVPCIVADDLTPEQIAQFRLVENKTSELAKWDYELLDEELKKLKDVDMTDFGFDMSDLEAEMVEEDDFEIAEVGTKEPTAKHGDIYQLGDHRLMCGDSTNSEDVKKLLSGGGY